MNTQKQYALIQRVGPSPGQRIELTQERIIIGRVTGVDLLIDAADVSRRHARIFRQNDRFYIEDLGSTNGTFVGEQLIQGPTPLNPGDIIRIGSSVELAFEATFEAPQTVLDADLSAALEDRTMLDAGAPPQGKAPPPQLIVIVAGSSAQTYDLTQERITIGRAEDNDIVIPSKIVSRHHARLEWQDGGYVFFSLPGATNPVTSHGRLLEGPTRLEHEQKLRIGGHDPGLMVTMIYTSPGEFKAAEAFKTITLGDKTQITIGRDPSNDVILATPNVSRFHAQIERVGQRFRLKDLRSSNGTFVNDQRVDDEAWLKPNDTIRIGPYRFVIGQDRLAQYDERGGFRVEAAGLQKWVRKDLNILQNISLAFQPSEFIVVVGQSGGGKSTLINALAGYRPATHGEVKVNGVDVYKNFDAVRNDIGYVPQRDIIHMGLTVYEALDYTARLRMPPDTTREERHQRVMEVLEELDLAHRKDVQVKGLSGGQQKRVSIGVELLTRPNLFFLDEPTSGLDPGTETAFMHLLRRLADQGRTIVLITHATKNVMLADKVVFLARGGYLAWFGPPDEALAFFDQYRSEKKRRTSPMEFDQIYSILEDTSLGTPEEWAARYQKHPAYRRYILEQLQDEQRALATGLMQSPLREPVQSRVRNRVSALRQFLVLSSRNVRNIMRDRASMILMLAAAPLVALLDVFMGIALGRDLFDYVNGDMVDISTTLFTLTIYSMMVGAMSQMREFVKEREIYQRERLVNLKILPYVLSKVWLAALLAFYQGVVFAVIRYIAFDMPGGTQEFILIYITLVLANFGGMMMGLFVSSIAPNANSAPLIIILFIIPQVVLSGAMAPIPKVASAPTVTHWAYEAFMGITGVGSDVAADPCWALPEELIETMTIEAKDENGCRCMGTSVFDPEMCYFPGVGQFYDPAVDQPEPQKPAPLGDPPPAPEIPPPPEEPAQGADNLALTEYFEALRVYQQQTERIQADYQAELDAYQARADVYEADLKAYQEKLFEWQKARTAAIGEAEGMIQNIRAQFGWSFVDKSNAAEYWTRVITTWVALAVISLAFFFLILFFIKRLDRV